ncbi:hypothetical protein [Microbispora bryophytorum]|uniref:hypothetical protein n=1 Tax=Microbispora bryophytorum TaxID=1460882 RepID=UPI0033F2CC0D
MSARTGGEPGCIETLCNLTGTPYGDIASFATTTAPEGLLVYVEASAEHRNELSQTLA